MRTFRFQVCRHVGVVCIITIVGVWQRSLRCEKSRGPLRLQSRRFDLQISRTNGKTRVREGRAGKGLRLSTRLPLPIRRGAIGPLHHARKRRYTGLSRRGLVRLVAMALRRHAGITLVLSGMSGAETGLRSKRVVLLVVFRAHDASKGRRTCDVERKAGTHAGLRKLIQVTRRRKRSIAKIVWRGWNQTERQGSCAEEAERQYSICFGRKGRTHFRHYHSR